MANKPPARITPDMLNKSGKEDGIQAAYFCALNIWLKETCPPEFEGNLKLMEAYWCFAIPNGGARDSITAGILKATGTRSGVMDVCIPFARGGYNMAWLEFKTPIHEATPRHGLSDNQRHFGLLQHNAGSCVRIFFGWQDAFQFTKDYFANLILKPLSTQQLPTHST